MKRVNPITKLFLLLSAITLTDNVFITYLINMGNEALASSVGFSLLAVTSVLSSIEIVKERRLWLPSAITVTTLLFLVWFQSRHDIFNMSSEFTTPFIVHGVGGFFMGLAIKDYEQYIKYLGIIASFYLLFLILEPINHNLLNLDEMLTGYALASLIVLLFLAYFTVFKKYKFFLIQALLMSGLVLFLTSRGCGLVIALSLLFFFVRERSRRGISFGRTFFVILCAVIALIIISRYALGFFMGSSIDISDGAFISKLAAGSANDSNGRTDIWELGLLSIAKNWQVGMGFGADRAILGDDIFIHDIFLELFINFGIPLSLILLFFYWRPIVKTVKQDHLSIPIALLMTLVFRTWGQLLFSSSYLTNMLNIMFIYGVALRLYVNNNRVKCDSMAHNRLSK